jgi:single-stranded-DNA-specific exonuclease
MEKNTTDDLFIPTIEVDLKIPVDVISPEFLVQLEQLKPYGLGNEEPVLMSERLGIADKNLVGKDKQHVSLKFYKDGNYFKGIFFNGVDATNDLVLAM